MGNKKKSYPDTKINLRSPKGGLSLTGFTMIEILVVIIIIGILAGLSLPNFTKTKEKALDMEAKISLNLIQNAEKFVFMKNMAYYNGTLSNLTDINTNLQLALPESSSWSYTITPVLAVSTATDYTATATRTGYDNRICTVTSADPEAHCP